MQGSRTPVAGLALILHTKENFFRQRTQFSWTSCLWRETEREWAINIITNLYETTGETLLRRPQIKQTTQWTPWWLSKGQHGQTFIAKVWAEMVKTCAIYLLGLITTVHLCETTGLCTGNEKIKESDQNTAELSVTNDAKLWQQKMYSTGRNAKGTILILSSLQTSLMKVGQYVLPSLSVMFLLIILHSALMLCIALLHPHHF